jgi:hypothetical protein
VRNIAVDLMNILGLTFNVIIVVVGYWSYRKSRDMAPLYISAAFVLFGISYIITILNLGRTVDVLIITGLTRLIIDNQPPHIEC